MGRKKLENQEVMATVSVEDGEGDVTEKAINVEVSNEELAKHVAKLKASDGQVKIAPVAMQTIRAHIKGNAPLVVNRWSKKAEEQLAHMYSTPKTQGRKGKSKTDGRDFEAEYHDSYYTLEDGSFGIPCVAFRHALVRACSLVDQVMTIAKSAIFIQPDGFDNRTATPLVKIIKGKPVLKRDLVINNGRSPDIRIRSMWAPGWEASVRIDFDSALFTVTDVMNLMHRAGIQVGIMEGRPSSKKSVGMGWGTFLMISGYTDKKS